MEVKMGGNFHRLELSKIVRKTNAWIFHPFFYTHTKLTPNENADHKGIQILTSNHNFQLSNNEM